jgi:orotate phosphoribosyltransferase
MNPIVVVDDVIITGGSTLNAIEAIQEEGGREAIESAGYSVVAAFTRAGLI